MNEVDKDLLQTNLTWKELNNDNFNRKYLLLKKKCKRVEFSYPRDNTRKPKRYKDPFFADVVVRERL